MSRYTETCLLPLLLLLLPTLCTGDVLDKAAILERHDWWDNRDFDWYVQSIPFLETPDDEIDKTYYYRWDMMTKHLVYGSPEHGYAFTEFIDRPPWSGTYGAISCPAGLQLYDLRWFRNPRYARDYTAYWFRVPGAQPRNYSTWLADSAWAIQNVWPDDDFTTGLLDDLVRNYEAWERKHWVAEMKMFWQHGMADGMETNINSRQTKNWFSGAPGFRPTLNSYLYADAVAIAAIAERAGNAELAEKYRDKAATIKAQVQDKLWDPQRSFFFHMFRDTEMHEGHTVAKHTLTHQTGRYAGNVHGRELIGYVPWQFRLPDRGYEQAWKYLMDSDYFYADRGPTVTERNDPLFRISPNCCVWSGNSWPYATGQTLKAMANALQNYQDLPITRNDYYKLLRIYALTHRKDGRPYIAEACHPDTGSWSGHDHFNHSEHYFHSCYIDNVITGLIGLEPQADNSLGINPLTPDSWDYFCLDGVLYKGRELTVVWDKDGSRYGQGKGLAIYADGKELWRSETLQKASIPLEPNAEKTKRTPPALFNLAVNNTGGPWPKVLVSSFDAQYPPYKLVDGQYWYLESPPNRWQSAADDTGAWCGVDFGVERTVSEIRVYPMQSEEPVKLTIEAWLDGNWQPLGEPNRDVISRRANRYRLKAVRTQKIRARFDTGGRAIRISELEAWGPADLPLRHPTDAAANLAFGADVSASSFNPPDPPQRAVDGRINYDLNGGANRWATLRRPGETPDDKLGSDILTIDFKQPKTFREVRLHFCRSRWGMGAPVSYALQVERDGKWVVIPEQKRNSDDPLEETINVIRFPAVQARQLRLEVHLGKGKPVTALSEIEVFE